MYKLKLLSLLTLLLLAPQLSQAQTAVAQNDTVSVIDNLKTLPLKEGFFYNIGQNRGENVLALEVLSYKAVGVDLTWIGVDGLGATLDYNLSGLPIKNNYVADGQH